MSITAISTLLEVGMKAIDKIFPDPQQAIEAKIRIQQLSQDGDLSKLNAEVQLLLGQLEVTKIEAASGSIFVAGWRPAVGWIAAISLGVAYIPKALAVTALWVTQAYLMMRDSPDMAAFILPPFPELNLTEILGLLGAMLGIGGMRSFDKRAGTDTKRITK